MFLILDGKTLILISMPKALQNILLGAGIIRFWQISKRKLLKPIAQHVQAETEKKSQEAIM